MNLLAPDSICVPSDDVVSREIEGELIIVPIASGIGDLEDELYTLNDTGRAIWKRLDGSRTLVDVSKELSKLYAVPLDRVEGDVLGLCTQLVNRKILVCRT